MEAAVIKKQELRRKVVRLAWPAIFENIMLSLVEFIDTAMVGSLGAAATAAVAINNPTIWMLNSSVAAIAVGGTVYSAYYIGAKDEEKAKTVSRSAFFMIFMFGIFITALMVVLGRWTPLWMGAEPEIQKDASDYIRILALCFLPHFTGIVLSGVMRGAGDTRTPMLVNVLVNVINVAGNFFMIFPARTISVAGREVFVWGAGLGVQGAAIASSFAMAVGGLILLALLMVRKSPVQLRFNGLKADVPMMRRMLKVGLPAAFERLSTTTGVMLFTRTVATLGTVSLAAHQLAVTAESICYMPGFGFQAAATTLTGQSMGAGKPEEAKKSGMMTFRMCTGCMIVAAVLLFFGAEAFVSIFTPDPEVIRQGAQALRIVAVAEPFSGAALVLIGALRGAGDTKFPFLISLCSVWGIRLVLSALFVFVFQWGLNGAWLAMGLDLIARGTFAFFRFRSGKWQSLKMEK